MASQTSTLKETRALAEEIDWEATCREYLPLHWVEEEVMYSLFTLADVPAEDIIGMAESIRYSLDLDGVENRLHLFWCQPAVMTVKPLLELALLIPPY